MTNQKCEDETRGDAEVATAGMEKCETQMQKPDRVYFRDSRGHIVSEEYEKKCPHCGGPCTVHRSIDGTAGSERCHVCDFKLRW